MQKAIFSRIDLNNADNDLAQEYLSCIRDLLHLHDVQDLKAFTQHMNTSRFQHSLNVSYYTFLIARRFHLDSCSAARAGLLHDLYHYDWRNLDKEERPIEGRHCAVHPQIALENARKATFVNTIIEDAIVHHMWPMTLRCPKTKEAGFCRLLINTAPSAKFFCRVEEECDIPDLLFHWLHCFPSAFDSTYIQIMLCLGFISGHSFFLLSNEHAA